MRYYFYTLNKEHRPEDRVLEKELLTKSSNTNDKELFSWYMLAVAQLQKLRKRDEEYEFQNGQDVRYFVRYGVKEINEETYNQIVEDDIRIVSGFNQKTLDLMNKFGHRKDGWHFPFYVDAESRSHLKWKLKQMFPEYKEFIFKD
jgi:uncharacterized protein YneR